MGKYEKKLYALLRAAMTGNTFEEVLTDDEWRWVYKAAAKQSLLGVCFQNRADMPTDMAMKWAAETEIIRGLNKLLNEEAARLTKLFAEQGRKSAILKGQANARLYPYPFSRQPGDIDIWVEGGRNSVVALLRDMQILSDDMIHYHHAHIKTEGSIKVDVHFRPSSGNFNPITNRRLQKWLEQEINQTTYVDIRFNVPTISFALVMQLAHIQHHFLASGIGLRQVCDYYCLLKNATEDDRMQVASLLKRFGLWNIAGALMWVLDEVLNLDESLMLCPPDNKFGKCLLRGIMTGGNFGRYDKRKKKGLFSRTIATRLWHLKLVRFNFWEIFWLEISFLKILVRTPLLLIKYRTLSLKDIINK